MSRKWGILRKGKEADHGLGFEFELLVQRAEGLVSSDSHATLLWKDLGGKDGECATSFPKPITGTDVNKCVRWGETLRMTVGMLQSEEGDGFSPKLFQFKVQAVSLEGTTNGKRAAAPRTLGKATVDLAQFCLPDGRRSHAQDAVLPLKPQGQVHLTIRTALIHPADTASSSAPSRARAAPAPTTISDGSRAGGGLSHLSQRPAPSAASAAAAAAGPSPPPPPSRPSPSSARAAPPDPGPSPSTTSAAATVAVPALVAAGAAGVGAAAAVAAAGVRLQQQEKQQQKQQQEKQQQQQQQQEKQQQLLASRLKEAPPPRQAEQKAVAVPPPRHKAEADGSSQASSAGNSSDGPSSGPVPPAIPRTSTAAAAQSPPPPDLATTSAAAGSGPRKPGWLSSIHSSFVALKDSRVPSDQGSDGGGASPPDGGGMARRAASCHSPPLDPHLPPRLQPDPAAFGSVGSSADRTSNSRAEAAAAVYAATTAAAAAAVAVGPASRQRSVSGGGVSLLSAAAPSARSASRSVSLASTNSLTLVPLATISASPPSTTTTTSLPSGTAAASAPSSPSQNHRRTHQPAGVPQASRWGDVPPGAANAGVAVMTAEGLVWRNSSSRRSTDATGSPPASPSRGGGGGGPSRQQPGLDVSGSGRLLDEEEQREQLYMQVLKLTAERQHWQERAETAEDEAELLHDAAVKSDRERQSWQAVARALQATNDSLSAMVRTAHAPRESDTSPEDQLLTSYVEAKLRLAEQDQQIAELLRASARSTHAA